MAAMMLPSELPLLRLDYATARSRLRLAALGLGYLGVWLDARPLPSGSPTGPTGGRLLGLHGHALTAGILAAAAVYQLTPLKHRCLAICRAPLARILHGWRDGATGAFRMGVVNGLWCVGCCVGLTACAARARDDEHRLDARHRRCDRDREDDARRRRSQAGDAVALALGAVAWAI